MANLVKFIACSAAAFQAATKDASTLYFVEDEQRLYKGEVPYSGGIYQVVANFPETGALNTIYKNSQTGEVAFWNGTAYQTLVKPMGEVAADNAGLVTGGQVFAAVNAVQGEVDALETYVGTFTHASAQTVVEYIDAKTAGIATDAALTELTNRVTTAEGEIDAIQADYLKAADRTALEGLITAEADRAKGIEGGLETRLAAVEGDYLKAADKTELEGKITAEATTARAAEKANADAIAAVVADYLKAADKTELSNAIKAEEEARIAADEALDGRLDEVEAFFKLAEGQQLDTALDTLIEIQNFINSEGAAADQMVLDIKANKEAIEAEVARATKAEGDLETAYKAADEALDGRIDVLEALLGDGEGNVADQIEAAKNAAIAAAAADATDKAGKAETAAKGYADQLNTAMDTRVQAVEAAKHTHSNKELLDTYTQTEANLADAVAKKHDHTNKTVLDGITAEKVTAWDAAEGNAKAYAKTYADGLAGNYATAAQGAKADTALQAADIVTGATNGTIAVKGTNVAVMGLKSAAYTESSAYATAAQGALAASAVQEVVTGVTNGTIKVDGVEVAVAGLKSAAFTEASDYATAAQGTKADEAHAALTWGTL